MHFIHIYQLLQGYLEISGSNSLTEDQVQIIKDHIALVLKKETPTVWINSGTTITVPFVGGTDSSFC